MINSYPTGEPGLTGRGTSSPGGASHTIRSREHLGRVAGAGVHNGAMRIESSVTSLSWIPSEAVRGGTRVAFDAGFTHYDEPPPMSSTTSRP